MDKICRFCLKLSVKNMCSLQECDILFNLQRFLKIHIPTNEYFPKNLCKECFKNVSKFIKFCLTLKENEDELQSYARNGLLEDYYAKITHNVFIKDEAEEPESKMDTFVVKVEDEMDTDYYEEYEFLKSGSSSSEVRLEFNETHNSSDEAALSSIKEENEINIEKEVELNIEEKPQITDFKPVPIGLENFKRKRKDEPQIFEFVKQFTCLSCLKECEDQSDLAKHYYAEHYSNPMPVKRYTEHELEDKITYTCDICGETFDMKKDIKKHVTSHSDERPLTCKICARTYRTVPDIVRHARAHNGIKLQCPYNCGFSTAYQGAMKEHTSKHLDEYKYTCDQCGKGFNTKTWFEQHQNLHTGEKPFVCDICGVAFPMSRYLQTHKAANHPQSSNLKRYRCVHCGEQCDSANSLAIHMQDHGIKHEKDFLCDFCGKILATAYQLAYHHRMHMGVKPYSCHICKKKFAKKYNVQLHMTIHSGDKSHGCSRCGKQYSQRSTLLRHLKRYHPDTSSENNGET